MSKERVERAHALVSQVVANDLNVLEPNIGAIRGTLSDVRLLLEQSLGMTAIPEPRDALTPVADRGGSTEAPLFGGESVTFSGNDEAVSDESATIGDLPEEETNA